MFTLACLIVLALMLMTLQLSRNATEAMRWVQHTYEVLNSVVQARSDTFQIELNTQSYRITGDEKRLIERDKAIRAREQSLQLIKNITQDNPHQQSRWLELRKVIDERLVITRHMVFLAKTQGLEAANAYVRTTPLQETRDRMYQLWLAMENEERELLNKRLIEQGRTRQITGLAFIFVGFLLIVLLVLTFQLIRKQLKEIHLSRKELAESENNLAITLHSIGDGVVATDQHGCITRMNKVSEKLTGWQLSEAMGRPIEDVFHIVNEVTGKPALIPIEKAIKTREVQTLENHTILIERNGNMHPIADSAAPIIDSNGNLTGVVLVFRDVTLEHQAERVIQEQNLLLEKKVQERTLELYASEESLRSITDNVPALIAYVDAHEYYIYANQRYIDRFAPNINIIKGLTVREVLGHERYSISAPYIAQVLLGQPTHYDWQPFLNIWQMVNHVPTVDMDGKITGYYVMISDITDRKLAELNLYNLTHFDALTGLSNETQFTDLLNDAIESGLRLNQSFALVQINIDELSEINDALGFSKGDEVLQEFAKRLKLAANNMYALARLRGDEFAMILSNCRADEAIKVVNQLESALSQSIVVSNIALEVSAKIGIAMFPAHGITPHDLYRHTDFAVRQAKKKGKRVQVFDLTQDSDKPHRLTLAAELRQAIDHNNLELYLQPKVEFRTGQVCGVEALIRWNHPQRGLISPMEFIPLAEQIGLIKPLTQWVMSTALLLIHEWESTGFIMPIAINLSARNLNEDDLVDRVRQMQLEWNISSELFEIEVTESAIMDDAQHALEVLNRLREQGISLSIDDFGTGYSSLSYLQRLPMQFIKIDQSFVSDMLLSKESLMIVRSTIDLAHELGRKVVAEGVETQEHWDQLAELGCDIAQGYFIAKPMPVSVFMTWIKDFKSTTKE